jgi:hypothetical protein
MIPDYILMNAEDLHSIIGSAVGSTPGVQRVFLHRSQKNEGKIAEAESIVEDMGLKIAN